MAIAKQTVKVYTRSQLETFGLAELKAISGNYSRLIDRDCTPSKYSNRKSAWMEAIESAQTAWQQQQAPVTDTLFDLSAYSQPHNTHRGLSEHRIDTTGYDPYWDEIDEDLQDNEASPGVAATENSTLEPITVSGDSERREEFQEICSSIENNPVPEVEAQGDLHIGQQPACVIPYIGEQLSLFNFDWEERADISSFCSPDVESALAAGEAASEQPAPEKPGFCSPDIESAAATSEQSAPQKSPAVKSQSPITRSEAAAALGVTEDRILKDPTPTLNCVCVVYLDDQGKKRSQFVSYRRFEFWQDNLREAINAASPETIEAVEERIVRELGRFHRHYPTHFSMELKTALSHKKASLFSAKGASKKSSKKAIAV